MKLNQSLIQTGQRKHVTISLFLAQKAKQVYGVEIVADAIKDAKENAELNGIYNVAFQTGVAEKVIPE